MSLSQESFINSMVEKGGEGKLVLYRSTFLCNSKRVAPALVLSVLKYGLNQSDSSVQGGGGDQASGLFVLQGQSKDCKKKSLEESSKKVTENQQLQTLPYTTTATVTTF